MKRVFAAAILCVLAACDDDSSSTAGDGSAADGASDLAFADLGIQGDAALEAAPGDAGDAAGDGSPKCVVDESSCPSKTQQRICKLVAGASDWVTEPCANGTLCLDDRCSAECVDQCNMGETRAVAGATETCKLYSVAKDAAVSPGSGLHDRARKYNAWLREHHLPGGTVSDAYFSDAAHTKVVAFQGTGDSAIWTGSYLAAEALRLKVTGSKDAEANVEKIVEAIHRLFKVTGLTGYHARFTAPLNDPDPRIKGLYNPKDFSHHVTKVNGVDYFWNGNTSRDQNSGVVMGYALAYDALTSAAHRQMIREDMVGFCDELIKERKSLPVVIRFHALGKWHELSVPITSRYMVLNPHENKNGKPWIQVGDDKNPTDYEHVTMAGFREYWPDYAKVLKQIPILGALMVIPIPRSGSTIMLGAIFRTCLMVTKGESAFSAYYKAFRQFYDANVQSWLDKMKLYVFLNAGPPKCWGSYYGLNIVFEPVYNLVRLEDDAKLKAAFQSDVLAGKMWPIVKNHKNVFFSFIHAAHAPPGTAAQVIADATAQLSQFPPPPHAKISVNNSGKPQYPPDPQCPGNSKVAIDVKDRVASDFIWQRNPFTLSTPGDVNKVYPGVDFMLPYWIGRQQGFYSDDAKGTCLRWVK